MSEAEQLPDEEVTEDPAEEITEPLEVAEEQPDQREYGHMSREQWIDKGRNPDEWVSEQMFKERGELFKTIRGLKDTQDHMKSDYEHRFQNLNKLHDAKISDLQAQRKTAAEMADVGEVERISNQIDDLKTQKAAPAPAGKDPVISDWEAENPWINNPADPKTPYANQQYLMYANQGMSNEQAISAMESDLSRAFPTKQRTAPVAERQASKPGKKAERTLTMADVSAQDMKIRSMFGTEKEFLQAVKDSKEGKS